MKAILGNLVNNNRAKLEEVIPLKTPYTITIDPCNLCNFKCNFCAMQVSAKKQQYQKKIMELGLYKKIIDDITLFPEKLKILRINGQGEPLLNKNFCEMVRYAKQRKVANFIETITNGSQLNPKLNQELIDSGIDRIRISIEALDSIGYKDVAKANIYFDDFVWNIKDLYERSKGKCEIYIKIVDVQLPNNQEKQRFYDIFGNICDRIFVDKVIPLWSDFAEINETYKINGEIGVHGQAVQNVQVCPYPFYSFLINPEGQVTACCADWQRKLILGDVSKENLVEIWNGNRIRKLWIDHLKGRKNEYQMCQKCMLPMFDCNDNIDQFASEILKKFL